MRVCIQVVLLSVLAFVLVACRAEVSVKAESGQTQKKAEPVVVQKVSIPVTVVEFPSQDRRCVIVGQEEVCWSTPEEGDYASQEAEKL